MSKHTHVEAKGWCQKFSFLFPSTLLFKTGASQLDSLAGYWDSGFFRSLSTIPWCNAVATDLCCHSWLLHGLRGPELRSSCLCGEHRPYRLSHLPSLGIGTFLAISSCFPTVRAQLLSGLLMFQYHPLKVYFDIFKEADVLNSRRGICHVL